MPTETVSGNATVGSGLCSVVFPTVPWPIDREGWSLTVSSPIGGGMSYNSTFDLGSFNDEEWAVMLGPTFPLEGVGYPLISLGGILELRGPDYLLECVLDPAANGWDQIEDPFTWIESATITTDASSVPTLSNSILTSTKKILGLDESYTAFDLDVITHINSVFTTLHQLGIGPVEGFMIEDSAPIWADFLGDDPRLNAVKTYVYLRVRLLFDPPATSFTITAFEKQIQELEWRLNVHREFEASMPVEEI